MVPISWLGMHRGGVVVVRPSTDYFRRTRPWERDGGRSGGGPHDPSAVSHSFRERFFTR